MRVTVAAFGGLSRYLLDGAPERTLELAEGATLAEVAQALGADPDELPLARRGGEIVREATPLRDGDRIELFAPVGGG